MRIIIVAYINSDELIEKIEGIMCYDNFLTKESNLHFRVFEGHFNGHGIAYFKQLFQQLNDLEFNINDSIFLVYPVFTESKSCTISTLVLKRMGNKHLRTLKYK